MSKESREQANAERKARYEANKAEIKANHAKKMAEIRDRSLSSKEALQAKKTKDKAKALAEKEALQANKTKDKAKALAEKEALQAKKTEDRDPTEARLSGSEKRYETNKALVDFKKVENLAKHENKVAAIQATPTIADQKPNRPEGPKSKVGWITVGTILFVAFLYGITANTASTSGSSQGANQPLVEATFYDTNTIPFFVGRTAASSAIMMRDEYDQDFYSIKNIDTSEEIYTFFDDNSDLEKLDGLYVCTQSMAPGADVPESAFMYIVIEISKDCANKKVPFAMGPAAKEIGQYVPVSLNRSCYSRFASECNVPQMDGVVIGFPDEGWTAYKSVLVATGMGVMEVELALIGLSDEWCGADDSESQDIREKAVKEKIRMLTPGSFVRIVNTDALSAANKRFVHRLTPEGQFLDGQPPSLSVNELLVSSGFWIPDEVAGSHAWERLGWFTKGLKNAVWQPDEIFSDDVSLSAYRKRILKAANLEFAKPNPILANCLQSKESQVLAIYSEEDEKRRSAYSAVKKESQYWAIWRSVFCSDGGAKNYPQRCKGFNSTVEEDLGAVPGGGFEPEGGSGSDGGSTSGGGSVSGGGSNCTWVNAYTRNGSSVRGHWRCG